MALDFAFSTRAYRQAMPGCSYVCYFVDKAEATLVIVGIFFLRPNFDH